ncbi:alpha/beta hydrolase family protein [Bradyrhizobium erythrophlei]|uniref:alpha/beta hydrolase family protein n=1 Tax=Bradyrhizobium erythrophlei TaxID=1437360 RepID=UPI0035EC9C59
MIDYGIDYASAVELFARTSAGEPWDEAAEAIATRHLARAAEAVLAGHVVTSSEALADGIAALIFAQMAFNSDVERKRTLYRDLVRACLKLTEVYDLPLQRVEIPFAGARLIGWLVRPAAIPIRGTVVIFGGQSGWGMAYLQAARALAKRGLAALLAEGPGQGETRLEQHIYLDVDVPAAYQALVSYVTEQPELGRPGIWGNSYGGLWAAKTAARDKRIAACCVNGSFARPRLLPFRTAFEQSAAMLGTEDEARINRNFERMSFEPGVDQIACPLLVLHGGADPLVQQSDQSPFLDGATTKDKTLRIWPDGEHTIYNHGRERTSFVADWFTSRLSQPDD